IAPTLQLDDGNIKHNNEVFDSTRGADPLLCRDNARASASRLMEESRIKRERNPEGQRHYCTEVGCMVKPSGFTRRKDMLRHVQETHREKRPFVCSREYFKAELFCKNMPDKGCGKAFKREAHLMAHW